MKGSAYYRLPWSPSKGYIIGIYSSNWLHYRILSVWWVGGWLCASISCSDGIWNLSTQPATTAAIPTHVVGCWWLVSVWDDGVWVMVLVGAGLAISVCLLGWSSRRKEDEESCTNYVPIPTNTTPPLPIYQRIEFENKNWIRFGITNDLQIFFFCFVFGNEILCILQAARLHRCTAKIQPYFREPSYRIEIDDDARWWC